MLFKFKTWKQIQEIKERVIIDILNSELMGISPIIDYAKFLRLYKKYEDVISEKEFASILEINYSTMINGTRVKVLKSMPREIEQLIQRNEKTLKRRIIEDIVYSGKIGISQFITYPRFLEFYESYKEILTEKEFGKLLEIRIENIKTGGRSKILNSMTDEIKKQNEKCAKAIIVELIKTKRVIPGQLMNYKNFLKLYEPYKSISTDREFATVVQYDIDNVKYNGMSATILKSYINKRMQDTDEVKEDIVAIQKSVIEQKNNSQTTDSMCL